MNPGVTMTKERRARILVIDDDASVREVVSLILESLGYDCETAPDGTRGLVRFDEGGWDLVVTDLAMPEINGWEVAETVRRRAATVPIILITGLADAEIVNRAEQRGLPVVPKPFRWELLSAAVTQALQGRPALEPHVSPN